MFQVVERASLAPEAEREAEASRPHGSLHFGPLSQTSHAQESLRKLTVAKLQALLRKHGQKASGKKDVLIQRALKVPDILTRGL